MTTPRFGSVITAMATPFDAAGALDLDGAVTLARWLTGHGSDGLVVAGTTGESPVLSDAEKLDLWRAVSEAVTVPVIAGSTSNDTAHSLELTRRAAETGVAAILAVTPYYNRPGQAGLDAHFRAVAAAVDLPVMIYDIPVRTGRKVAHETLVRLATEVPGIVAVKDAAGDPAGSARLVAEAPAGFELYSGDDNLTLPLLAVGAVGLVSVASHWAGETIAEMISAFTKGDVEHARSVNAVLLESWAFEGGDAAPNPIPTKAMLRVMGLPAGQCRLPMGDAPAGLEARAAEVLANLRAPAVADPVRLTFLGGLGEIGRNSACLEVGGRILIIDCGLMFPDLSMPGVDLVLPDFSWLRDNAERVEACVLTHGHEDHVGALSYLLRELEFPIYGSELTLGLARNRIEEAGLLDRTSFHQMVDGQRIQIGPFDVEFIPVAHSVPHGFAIAIHTPQGVVLHSGDWKIDLTPVDGRRTDLSRIGAIATTEGVRLLLADSTNAEEAGHTVSEREVGRELRRLVAEHAGKRLIVACFASHLHRIQEIVDAAIEHGRTVATLGRSMGKNINLARQLGLLSIPDASIVDIEQIADLPPGKVCVLSTGSQGEPMSALALMAAGENRWVQIGSGDTVIISAHPIPGNEYGVSQVIDGLHRLGADVIHSGLAAVHVSGHAKQGEMKTLLSVAKPDYFIPVHGEFRHLTHHSRLASEMGIPDDHVLLCEDGDVVELTATGVDFAGEVPAGYLYVDGIVGDVGRGVLRDRRVLAEEGVVVVVATVDSRTGALVAGPEIFTRGWVYAPEADNLIEDGRKAVALALEDAAVEGSTDVDTVRRRLRQATGKFVQERTRRRPMIVPIVMEV